MAIIGNPLAVALANNNAEGIKFVQNEQGQMELVEFPGGLPTQAQVDAWGAEYARPKHEAKKWGIALETLRPYYVSRSVMNSYQAMDAAGKEAFRAQFDTGTEDRWTMLKDFVLNIRQLWSQNPVTWAEWDSNNPTYTQADFVSAWTTIQSWASE